MSTTPSVSKRNRISSSNEETGRTPKRKQSMIIKMGVAPQQYTPVSATHKPTDLFTLDIITGEAHASLTSKKLCESWLEHSRKTISTTVVPQENLRSIIQDCACRTEAHISRTITPLIVPSIETLVHSGETYYQHLAEERKCDWYKECNLEGKVPCPSLAIGFSTTAFTRVELQKLESYKTLGYGTRFTKYMYFPFLVCELKFGKHGFETADRHCMFSCSVALNAILRLEQKADEHRDIKKLQNLDGKALVFSITHDNALVRLFGYYAKIQDNNWTYYRYPIASIDIVTTESSSKQNLLSAHNFAMNVLKDHSSALIMELKEAIAVLPTLITEPKQAYTHLFDSP